ncbi:MAG TPA: ATPase domain-containing protein [Steroidobacteraceae bacterium]|nr:ATPase domain-containing protein [Steroidobacteraceae bacterium]
MSNPTAKKKRKSVKVEPKSKDGNEAVAHTVAASPSVANAGGVGKSKTNAAGKVTIRQLPTGVRGLDEILGGGIPEFSFNIIAGTPGCGKTTLAHQIVFANATPEKPALYFTVLGEPAVKMLRYQQQYSFFDMGKLDKAIRFVNLSDLVTQKDLPAVLDEITKQVMANHPSVVVVDSFRSVVRKASPGANELDMQDFVQRLAQFLTSWEATTFLVGEYVPEEMRDNPLFTVADGLLWLSQIPERNSVVRKLQIFKLRGQASVPGLHTFHIRDAGLQAFSRTLGFENRSIDPARTRRKLSTGIEELDIMMNGGIIEGDSLLVAGPSGTGKSVLATQFIAAGVHAGEPAVVALFEERPLGYTDRADSLGLKLKAAEKKGTLEVLYMRPLDLSVDQITQEILDAVERVGAKRLVIDSLVGFEMALAPGFREDFRESLYRMIVALTGAGVTILTTVEVEDSFTSLQFSHYTVSFLTDDIIRMRYVEIDGQLRKILVVIKMRGGNHSKDIREYVISHNGVMIIKPRSTEYEGLTTGIPTRVGLRKPQAEESSPEPKAK